MKEVHAAARDGFAAEAPTYARGRPDYPVALQRWLDEALALGPGKVAIDLGAGTGKFTRLLLAAGAQVTAVEPVAEMRTQFAAKLPGVPALDGTAQAIPLPDACADAVVCAQAFHWFATAAALAEIHRVLKPAGRLGLVWNVRDEAVDWVAAITALIAPYEGDTPRFYKGTWRQPFDGILFSAPEETITPYQHVGPPEEVIMDRFLSVSFIAVLPEPEKAGVAARLRALIDTHPALRGRATIAFPYQTRAYCCRRLPAAT
jgi:SAM-dependent methyltransferase